MLGQRRILWFAIVFSTVIYAAILYSMTAAKPVKPFDEAVKAPMVMALYAMAALCFVIGLAAFGRVKAINPQAGMILRLALFEAAAVMGLLAGFLGQDWRLYLPAWALALIGFFREWPTDEGYQGAGL